jgi:two-component system LytT family sensor kinase
MKRSLAVLLHIGFWSCYLIVILIILGVLYGEKPGMEAKIEKGFEALFLFAFIPSLISFYLFYFLIFPKFLQQKRFVLAIVFAILISVGSALVGYGLVTAEFGGNCVYDAGEDGVAITIFLSFITLVSGVIALVLQGFITWFGEIKLKEILQQKNHEMEMALVKSQLDPHFLFNTINNIDVLILKDATEASNYLNKLSDILRFMLYETKPDKILLSREIEYIEKYIELQKIRTSNSNYVKFLVSGVPGNKTIAPMVFIPFIENAFKHTSNKKLENAINISIRIENESIQFVCENKYNSGSKKQEENNGLGNDLIQKRLNLIYPGKHKLLVVNEKDLYSVHLTINHG